MALAEIKKIQMIAISQHKEKILEILQNSNTLDIIEISDNSASKTDPYKNIHELQKTELDFANTEFAINLLSKYAKKRGMLEGPLSTTLKEAEEKTKEIDYKKIADKCTDIEEETTKAKNKITTLQNDLKTYSPWKNLKIELQDIEDTEKTKVIIGSLKSAVFTSAIEKLHKISDLISSDVVGKDNVETHLMIIFSKELDKEIRQILSEYKFTEADLPKEKGLLKNFCKKIEKEIEENKKIIKEAEKELKELAPHSDDLKIINDYFGWQKEKLETEKKLEKTESSFAITAWIQKQDIEKIEKDIEEETKQYAIKEIPLEKGENPPVIIKNSNFMSPFEAVTGIYGLPKSTELDPTPFLAAFFILFFALCLTDAGYGIIMFIVMGLALKYIKLGDGIRKLVKLLMYGGIVTFFIGALFGGWFGLTADQVPEFLTYVTDSGEKMFLFQKINSINSPITVLILAIALGFAQILLGVTMKFIHELKHGDKKEAILNSGTWVFMLSGIGFFILTSAGVLPSILGVVGKWWVLLATAILVLTQGREKKNIIAKLLGGVLSLYGLVGYMSDILSYSRLLALGLATAIIGLAVNIVADLVGGLPYIGWIIMIVVFIGGHIFNLLINALGAFIHSGRLQFVEFFTKFMEGGGKDFKPFSKKSKYIYIKNN